MRKIVGVIFLTMSMYAVFGQSSVGINTQEPNPNAALHVVSPTNNQGLLVPSVTTSQRQDASFVDSLDTADNGLLVFDTDENTFYYWDDTSWEKVSKGDIPALDTILRSGNSAGDMRIINLANPINNQDAVTKIYVDDEIAVVNDSLIFLDSVVKSHDSLFVNVFDTIRMHDSLFVNVFDTIRMHDSIYHRQPGVSGRSGRTGSRQAAHLGCVGTNNRVHVPAVFHTLPTGGPRPGLRPAAGGRQRRTRRNLHLSAADRW
ncbi:MAG: hypothetical protein R6U95_02610 [Bacteroidales bacterium]